MYARECIMYFKWYYEVMCFPVAFSNILSVIYLFPPSLSVCITLPLPKYTFHFSPSHLCSTTLLSRAPSLPMVPFYFPGSWGSFSLYAQI